MSKNSETIQQMFVSFGKGDILGIIEQLADDVTFSNTSNTPIGVTYHGKAGAMEYSKTGRHFRNNRNCSF